ncbi:hypothetical protein POKO110462_12290 [Pontibacter korlensis]|uniref:N-acetylglucosamine kinase n=1 Tax=Pontibacter korlensis TaxID=400092 RepID=A0A0E3ZCI4_9BACT|nr:hypothetical protein [Pontibacter korlensis]AKD02495.1 hypothetical protein PKOR_04380 [Pontibacter korlensis]
MILIADSGSTKTDWRLLTSDSVLGQAQTAGFNPMYQEADEIYQEVHDVLLPQLGANVPTAIYYYGAGCSTPDRNKRVENALRRVFPDALIDIDHDLLGAARAICGREPGIACILGTGSNTCLYNGTDIIDNVPSLGFLLGDEGSGAFMGKLLIKAFMYRELPEELATPLKNTYNLNKDTILEALYGSSMPSRYVASFAKFMHDKQKHPIIRDMIYENFSEFFERHVLKYDGHESLPVNFVGSVAFHFSDILKQVAKKYGLCVETIIKSPIEGLILYHQELLQTFGVPKA